MANSINSLNCNKITPIPTHSFTAKGDHHHHTRSYTKHPVHGPNHSPNRSPKESSTITLNIHDSNDIRYSKSNTQLQLTRLSLSASLIEIYFGKHYRAPDVLVVTGFLLILIGLGAILIGVYGYLNQDEFQEMTFLVGCAMAAIGFICCSCRIILFGPPLFNCCHTIKSSPNNDYHNQRRPTNPPFFTAASTAMSTVTSIGVRFNSSRENSTTDNQRNHRIGMKIESPSKSLNDLSITSFDGDSLQSIESIQTIKDGPDGPDKLAPIDPSMLQFISKLGNSK